MIKLQRSLDDGSLTSADFDVEGGEQMDNMNKTGGAPATANSTSDVKSTDAMLGNIILYYIILYIMLKYNIPFILVNRLFYIRIDKVLTLTFTWFINM